MPNKKGIPVPVFTPGSPGKPSVRVEVGMDAPVYSSYSGKQLPCLPNYGDKTDDPTGKNPTYHGGIHMGSHIMVHFG